MHANLEKNSGLKGLRCSSPLNKIQLNHKYTLCERDVLNKISIFLRTKEMRCI